MARFLLFVAALGHRGDVVVAFVGDDGFRIVVQLLLQLADVLLDVRQSLLRQVQMLLDTAVTLEDLDGVPPLLLLGETVDGGFFDMGDGVLHLAGEDVAGSNDALMGGFDGDLGGFQDAVTLESGDLHHRATQDLTELFGVNVFSVLADQVHHIDGHHHGDTQLHHLGGEI